MVRASRVTNPFSRALGAGIAIGGMTAAVFLMTEASVGKPAYNDAHSAIVKDAPAP